MAVADLQKTPDAPAFEPKSLINEKNPSIVKDGILPSAPAKYRPRPTENGAPDSRTVPQNRGEQTIGPLIRLRDSSPKTVRRIDILQQWECVVTDHSDDVVWAELEDLTNPANVPETAEFLVKEISESDRSLIAPGAVFYWTIGYDYSEGGQIRRFSEIRMRRSAVWSTRSLERIRSEAVGMWREMASDGQANCST